VSDDRSSFVTRAVGWLRQGYPTGVPRQDYVALLGLLQRSLTEEEVRKIANGLAGQSLTTEEPLSTEDIEQAIRDSVLKPANPEDVVRVSARLAAGGWPLADPPQD
jgi:hypothetical protein